MRRGEKYGGGEYGGGEVDKCQSTRDVDAGGKRGGK